MAFGVYAATQSEGSKPAVDYEALNKYLVETAKLENPEVLIGYVAAIVDLGKQEQEDAEMVFEGSAEDEVKEIEKYPNTYFEDGINPNNKKPCRMKRWPQQPQQMVAVAVDFPDIIVDKGQFFGESNPQPLRIWMGGQFFMQGKGMVVAQPIALRENKKLGNWSFDQKNVFYQMAVAAKIIQPGDVFKPARIDELLGKSFQFECRIWMKENKGKQYLTEKCNFKAGLGRGQQPCEIVNAPFQIGFYTPNKDEDLKNLRAHILNTIQHANNFEGSMIQSQMQKLNLIRESTATPQNDESSEEEQPEEKPTLENNQQAEKDCPF